MDQIAGLTLQQQVVYREARAQGSDIEHALSYARLSGDRL
jgi:hypothetical protein